MTPFATIKAGHSLRAAGRIWWSVGVHAVILLLCLIIGSIPPTPAAAVERPHVILIAPVLPAATHFAKKIPVVAARIEPKVEAIVTEPRVQPRAPKVASREFIAPAKRSPAPARPGQLEIASLQPLEPVTPVIALSDPLPPGKLPPPPIVVGKLSGATTASAPAPSGVVVTSGFGTSPGPAAAADSKTLRASNFQGAEIASAQTPRTASRSLALTRPIEILKKPQAVYTAEARALRLEGEVLLEVVFTSSAEVRVLRVVRGLGHGLDEAAIASASRIEFRPALREGEPTDQTVTVHIRFQLAY